MYRSEAASPERWQGSQVLDNHSHQNSEEHPAGREEQPTQSSPVPVPPAVDMSRPSSRTRGFKRGPSLIELEGNGTGAGWEDLPEAQQEKQDPDLPDEERLAKTSVAQTLVFSLLENTGAHGIPNIKRAPNNFRKIFWTGLFLAGLVMFIWQTCWLVARYYAYDVNIKLEISDDRMVEFPAVTICNLNPIKSDFFDDLIDQGIPVPPSLTRPQRGYGDDDEDEEFDDRFEMVNDAVDFVAAFKYRDRQSSGHLLKDMLLRCSFQGRPCHVRDFTFFHHYLHGNCFIFNAGPEPNTTATRRFVTKAGPLYGLTLELYIEQDQYMENIQPSAGARVVVHAHHDMPFPDDEGVSVSPGQETFIGFTRTNYTRLVHPYSNCTEVDTANSTIFNLPLPHIRYTQQACESDCYYQNVITQCGCADVKYRYDDEVPLCSNETQESCRDSVEMMYRAGMLDCKCTSPCRELQYDLVTGQARWPNEKYKTFLLDSIGNFSEDLEQDMDQSGDPDFLEKNVLKLNVYYDRLQYTTISQEKAYDEVALLSDMGGNVGLWIGVSVLTVFEFFELFYDLGKLIFYRFVTKSGTTNGKRNGKVTSSDIHLQQANFKVNEEEKHNNYEA